MDLELLLAYADDTHPVLEGGLSHESAAAKAKPGKFESFLVRDGDPNDLSLQRWAIIAPEGPDGDRLLDLVAPLKKKREEDQGEPVAVYRAPDGVDTDDKARSWKKQIYLEGDLPEAEQPLYLLVLGDLDRVSLQLQQVLATNLHVGRLVCPTDAGYAAYVEKVLRWEREPSPETQAPALFFTARDGTAATTIGYRALVAPSTEACRSQKPKDFKAREIVEIPYDGAAEAKEALLDQVARPDPAMLFSMSHGLGAPRLGWKSVAEQRALQGAMSMGSGLRITAEEVASRPFLPGGIWFFLACYGGGTPAESAYVDWLTELRDAGGFGGRVESVLAGLPKQGDSPFIAALPQAALANPNGPLAVMAHIDLAWTYSFQDMGPEGGGRPKRFEGIFRALVNGSRSGGAHHNLLAWLLDVNEELTSIDAKEKQLARKGTPVADDAARKLRNANLYMLRQDLSGYLMLGDPATRLPLSRGKAAEKPAPALAEVRSPPVAKSEEPAPAASPEVPVAKPAESAPAAPPKREVGAREKAVQEAIASEKAIADREGITREELRRWVDAYDTGGLAALEKLQ